jgi:hypothetical protein
LSIITFVGAIDIRLGKDEDLRAKIVPFNLGFLSFEERLPAGRRCAQVEQGMDVNARGLTLPFGNKDSDRGIEARTKHDRGCSFNFEFVNDALFPLSRVENLNIGTNKADGMGFGNGVLNIPSVQGLLRKGYELFPGGDSEDAQVLMLTAVSELNMTLPSGEICPAWRKTDINNIRNCELVKQNRSIRLMDTYTRYSRIRYAHQ